MSKKMIKVTQLRGEFTNIKGDFQANEEGTLFIDVFIITSICKFSNITILTTLDKDFEYIVKESPEEVYKRIEDVLK